MAIGHHGEVTTRRKGRSRFDPILMRLLAKADPTLTEEQINKAIQDTAEAVGKAISGNLRERSRSMLIDHASIRAGFEIRLRDIWGEALDALYAVYVVATESAEEYFHRSRDEAVAENDVVWEALLRVHARACHVASEIQALLRSGHAEGAQARWRTLHELNVVASFLSEHDDALATRYLEHEAITSWRDAEHYQTHAARLENEPFSGEEMAEMKADHDRLVAKYGRDYARDWGWAIGAMKGPLGFATVERATNLSHWRPFYRDANAALHAGSRRLSYRLGVEDAMRVWLTGPSNAGLDDPGISTSISLTMATVTTILYRPSMDDLISARALMELSDDADAAFRAGAAEYDRRVAEEDKHAARLARRRDRYRERREAESSRSGPRIRKP